MRYSLVVHGGAGVWKGGRRRRGLRGVRRAASNGCSVTGIGEGAIRLALAKTACDLIRSGLTPQKAAGKSVRCLQMRLGMRTGMITVDALGRIGSAHSTPDLCWTFVKSGMRGPRFTMK